MDRLILNCDLGEDELLDETEQLLSLVDVANICCGFHAGSSEKTHVTIERALQSDVDICIHPGLPAGGGRGVTVPPTDEFRQLLEMQVGSFQRAADALGASAQYIKLHGTLYHAVETNEALARAYIEFMKNQSPELAVFALAGGRFIRAAEASGLRVYHEAFADRAYMSDGSLVPRSQPDAVLSDVESLRRFKYWKEQGSLPTHDGSLLQLSAHVLCVHSDSPDALEMIREIKRWMIKGQ